MRKDRALSSALIRPICKVPPPPLPPPKRRLFPPAGGMRSHSIRSSWRRASRERWSSSIPIGSGTKGHIWAWPPSVSPMLPRRLGAVPRIAFPDPVKCVSYFTHLYGHLLIARCDPARLMARIKQPRYWKFARLSAGGGSLERTRLEAKFPASWENTGNFVRRGLRVRLLAWNLGPNTRAYDPIPYVAEQGIYFGLTGN